MKIAVLLSLIALFAMAEVTAQIKPDIEKIKANSKIKKTPSKAPAPAPVEKTPVTTTEPLVYTLTSVRVKIRTGNDNKEFPSNVIVAVKTKNTPDGKGNAFSQFSLSNEMRVNSETEFGLERQSPAQPQVENSLTAFQAQGLKMFITYRPNFFADAWKIEGVSVVLEFKDQHGNLHPNFGSKTIVFGNANGFLNNEYQVMECSADGNFLPLTAVIKK